MLSVLSSSLRLSLRRCSRPLRAPSSIVGRSFASLFSFMQPKEGAKELEQERRKKFSEEFFVESTKLTIAPHLEPAFLFELFFTTLLCTNITYSPTYWMLGRLYAPGPSPRSG